MLGPADVSVHRQPVAYRFRVKGSLVVVRAGEAQEVPGRTDRAVHCVRFPSSRTLAARAGRLHPFRHAGQRRAAVPRRREIVQRRQLQRQRAGRQGHDAALRTMYDGDRRAPVALAGDQPVAQMVADGGLAQTALLQLGDDSLTCFWRRQPVIGARVDQDAFAGVAARGFLRPLHHGDLRQVVASGEGLIALVVGRHAHDRAVPIAADHVVGDPDGQPRAGQGMHGITTGELPGRPLSQRLPLHVALALGLRHEGGDCLLHLWRGQPGYQRMLWCQRQVGNAEQRIGPGGEDRDRLLAALDGELHVGAGAAADPVALHRLNRLRPIDHSQVVQQPVGVGRDAQIPLRQRLALDRRAAAPAAPALDLLVSQDGAVLGAPPLLPLGAVGQPALVEQQEDPLRPAVVVRVGRVDLPRPVVAAFDELQLAAVVVGIAAAADRRMRSGAQGVVFGGQAEGVPAHRVQDVVTGHAQVARGDTGGHVVAAVSYREAGARRVGEEVQNVMFRPVRRLPGAVEADLLPVGAPLCFQCAELNLCGHDHVLQIGDSLPWPAPLADTPERDPKRPRAGAARGLSRRLQTVVRRERRANASNVPGSSQEAAVQAGCNC